MRLIRKPLPRPHGDCRFARRIGWRWLQTVVLCGLNAPALADEPAPAAGGTPAVQAAALDGNGSTSLGTVTPDEAAAADSQTSQQLPRFYVRDVTGPRPHIGVCLACQHGFRPLVLIGSYTPSESHARLMSAIDGMVARHRAKGMKAIGMFVHEDTAKLQAELMTLDFMHQFHMPLTIPVEGAVATELFGLELMNSPLVVLYCKDQKIVSRWVFQPQELTDELITQAVEQLESALAPPEVPAAAAEQTPN